MDTLITHCLMIMSRTANTSSLFADSSSGGYLFSARNSSSIFADCSRSMDVGSAFDITCTVLFMLQVVCRFFEKVDKDQLPTYNS